MKEELEIKHIYGYLMYGLDAWIDGVICEIEGVDFHFENTIIAERVNYKLTEVLPILRPISDVKKEEFYSLYLELYNGILAEALGNSFLTAIEKKYDYVLNIKDYHKLEEFMDKNHFDWKYNLIERGLAIDINTLKK